MLVSTGFPIENRSGPTYRIYSGSGSAGRASYRVGQIQHPNACSSVRRSAERLKIARVFEFGYGIMSFPGIQTDGSNTFSDIQVGDHVGKLSFG